MGGDKGLQPLQTAKNVKGALPGSWGTITPCQTLPLPKIKMNQISRIDISETMASVRSLMAKYYKRYAENPIPQGESREYEFRPPIDAEKALAVVLDWRQGMNRKDLCNKHCLSLPSVDRLVKANKTNHSPTLDNISYKKEKK